MKRQLNQAIDGLIQQLKEQGTHKETILNYQIVCNSILDFCEAGCFEKENSLYSFLNQYHSDIESALKNGDISRGYAVFKKRVIRLLGEHAERGWADTKKVSRTRVYSPNEPHQKIILQILDENHLSPSSRYVLDPPLRHFFCFVESWGLSIESITDNIFLDFLEEVSESNRGSMGRIFRALKLVFDFLKDQGITPLYMDISMLKVKQAATKIIAPFSHDEMNRIISAIDLSTATGMRDRAIILLAFETGLRAIDLRKLKRQDIDWKKHEISIIQSKNGTPLVLPLSGMVMNAVAEYILHVRPDCNVQEIFLTIRAPYRSFQCSSAIKSQFEKYCRSAGIEKKAGRSFHSIRRTYATEMSAAGVPLPTISQMLGHKNINKDKPYLSYNQESILCCALDFSDVPVTSQHYSAIPFSYSIVDKKGGESK